MCAKQAEERFNGRLATYAVESDIDFAGLRIGRKDEKEWAAWAESLPLRMRVLMGPAGYRAEWAGAGGKERWRLVRGPGGGTSLIDLQRGTFRALGKPPALDFGARLAIAWRDGQHPKWGPARSCAASLEMASGASGILTVEALMVPGGAPPMTHLWLALAPWLGEAAQTLGLPVEMRLRLPGAGGTASLRLVSLDPVPMPKDALDLPSGLKEVPPRRQRRRLGKKTGKTKEIRSGSPARAAAAGPRPGLFSAMGTETVKVIFHQRLLDAIFADASRASSYISGFRGTRFTFPTSDWFEQIVQGAPLPADNQSPSVVPGLLVRVFLGQICPLLRSLGLSPSSPDLDAAIDALPDSEDKKKLKAFVAAVGRRGDRRALNQLVERLVPGLGPTSPGSSENPCLQLPQEDLSTLQGFRGHPLVRLAMAWYGLLLPSVNVRPKYRTRQEIEDAVAVFRPSGEVDIDGLAELVDINLDGFEHSITFGNQPLFTPPAFVDTTALRTIGQLHPWFRPLQDVRFGFLTEFSLAGAEVSCGVDVTPTLSAATVALGFFCPPCLLSLLMTGSASASVEDARFPVFLYVEQDPFRLSPPRWRAVFAEPQFGDVSADVVLFGINWILALLLSVIGSIVGDFVLEGILQSLGSELGDAADGLLEEVPLLDAGTIARLGQNPDVSFPEESRPGYEAPARAAGGYQFETLRQTARGLASRLDFPAAGGTLDTDVALVLGPQRAHRLAADLIWPSYFGTFETVKPDGSVSEIDWWAEAPDQTGMPARPPQAGGGPPPGLLLIPQNVGQSWWSFATVLEARIAWSGWRDLTDSPADQAVGDVVVSARCFGEAIETEVILYEECEDVTHLAAGLFDRGPRGTFNPLGPGGPGDPVERISSAGPRGVMLAGRYLERRGRPGAEGEPQGPGWADETTVGYWFEPEGGMPLPDDPGPAPQPGVMLCRDIVTLNTRQRERWVEASLQFTLPVFVGLEELVGIDTLDQFRFLPAISAALGEELPAEQDVSLNLFATGPLQTLNLPANRDWLRSLLLASAADLARRVGSTALGDFHYEYGLDFVPEIPPERLQQPLALLRLATVTTWPHGAPSKRVAFKWELRQSLLGRA